MSKKQVFLRLTKVVCATVLLSFFSWSVHASGFFGDSALYRLSDDTPVTAIVIKFHEGSYVRLRGGKLERPDKPGKPNRPNTPEVARNPDRPDLPSVANIRAELALMNRDIKQAGRSARRNHRLMTEAELDAWRLNGESNTGESLADLNLFFDIPLPAGTLYGDIAKIIQNFDNKGSVDIVFARPEPAPPPSHQATPDFTGSQGYLGAPPNGINARNAWKLAGGKGENIKVVDVENSWLTNHEDLPTFFYDSGHNYIIG